MTQRSKADTVKERIFHAMASSYEEFSALMVEGQLTGWYDETNAVCLAGLTDWVAYLPGQRRACWISGGTPVWFEAPSINNAVDMALSGQIRKSGWFPIRVGV
jgi:hypothetical protein